MKKYSYQMEFGLISYKVKKFIGGKSYNNFYRDEDYPVFVKAGAIIPESTNIKEEIPTTLEVLVYPLSDGEYSLYEDDGFSNNYKNGLYMITKFNYHYEEDNYTFKISKENGRNLVSTRSYLIRFKNIKTLLK